ncbi:hypothetical protein [Glycocaulis albus]|uniref:hypothetical protein n=1 Tax=Glycocaulis albus TaxID=1382801 RepID=UPI00166F1A0E|nr:hypothetical protein [Glycocaulis albus]
MKRIFAASAAAMMALALGGLAIACPPDYCATYCSNAFGDDAGAYASCMGSCGAACSQYQQ